MASAQANKRLKKEYAGLAKSPPPYCFARPNESNLLECHFLIRGPEDSPYAGGEYHGVLTFPQSYPFAPPSIKVLTPSGRFQPDTKICTSMSDFHPGSWNPAWSIETILTGLLSFMLSDEITTGSIRSSEADKRRLAASSHAYNLKDPKFKLIFAEYATEQLVDLPNMAQKERGLAASSSGVAAAKSVTAHSAGVDAQRGLPDPPLRPGTSSGTLLLVVAIALLGSAIAARLLG